MLFRVFDWQDLFCIFEINISDFIATHPEWYFCFRNSEFWFGSIQIWIYSKSVYCLPESRNSTIHHQTIAPSPEVLAKPVEWMRPRVPTDLSAAVRGAELTHWWNKARGVAAAVSTAIGGDVCMPDISHKWSGSALAIPGFPSSFPPSSPAICSALAAPPLPHILIYIPSPDTLSLTFT